MYSDRGSSSYGRSGPPSSYDRDRDRDRDSRGGPPSSYDRRGPPGGMGGGGGFGGGGFGRDRDGGGGFGRGDGRGEGPPGMEQRERLPHYVLLMNNIGQKVHVRTLDNGNFEGVLSCFDKRHMNILLTKCCESRRRRVQKPKEEPMQAVKTEVAVKAEAEMPIKMESPVKVEMPVKMEVDEEDKEKEPPSFILERRGLPGPVILRGELVVSVTLV